MARLKAFILSREGRLFRLSFVLIAGLFYAVMQANSAEAQQRAPEGWQVCNKTSFILNAATGRPDGDTQIMNGWTKLRPGACRVLLPAPLDRGEHYLYAYSSDAHMGGLREWRGELELCVDPTVRFEMENPQDCRQWGLEGRRFQSVLIENRSRWTTDLTETDLRTREQARAAGVQRLLDDAGVFSGRIDGNLGAQTRAAVARFLRENELGADVSDADLIDLLEQAARQRSRTIGLTLCNRTDQLVWSAIGTLRGREAESRGWWPLEPGGCARAIDEPLQDERYYVYGEIEAATDGAPAQMLTEASEDFCIGPARFAIESSEDCEGRAFLTRAFVRVDTPADRKIVFEFTDRSFETAASDDD